MPSGGANKFTYEKVKLIFEENGFQLISTEYETNNTKMQAICPCGEQISIRLSDVQRGRRCQKCKAKKAAEFNRKKDDEIVDICNQHNCTLVKAWIHKSKTRIKFTCRCGREHEAYLCNFVKFPRCRQCGIEAKSGPNCYMYDPDREAVAFRKRFRKACEQFLRRAMRNTGRRKSDHTYKMLGYTAQELQDHIVNHPNYPSCKDNFHIDHIFPVQAFLDHGIRDLTLINRLDNLRPLFGPENISKADTYDKKEFEQWLDQRLP